MHAISERKNKLVLEKIAEHDIDVYEGSVRYLKAVRAAGLPTAVVSSSANCKQVIEVTGLVQYLDARVDGVTIERGAPARQAGAGHLPGRGQGAGRARPAKPPCSRTRWPGSPRARRAASGSWSASTGWARRTGCASTAPTVVVDDLADLLVSE